MKSISFVILLFFGFGCNSTSNWKKVIINEKNFEISFPFQSYRISNEIYHAENIGEVTSFEIDLNTEELNHSNLGYSIVYYEYPKFKLNENITQFFRETIDNLTLALNASKLYEKEISYNDFPGKEVYYFLKSKNIYITRRMYIINNKQYALCVVTNKDNLFNSSINIFFNSFKLIDI